MQRKDIIHNAITRQLHRSKRPMTCLDLLAHVRQARDHKEISVYLSRMHTDGLLRRFPAGPGYPNIRHAYLMAEGVLPAPVQVEGPAQMELTPVKVEPLPLPEPARAQVEAAPIKPRIHVRGNPEDMTITDKGSAVVIGLPGFEVTIEAV